MTRPTDKLMVQWVDMEDGGGLYFRLKDGRAINEVLADTMRENEWLKEIPRKFYEIYNGTRYTCNEEQYSDFAEWIENYYPNKDTDNG